MSSYDAWRLGLFGGLLLLLMLCEWLFPKRPRRDVLVRWWRNGLLSFINTLLLRFVVPITALGAASYAADHTIGLFHFVPMPHLLAVVLALLMLDAAIYWQHRLFHEMPFLWRLHKVHHIDHELDVTSGVRFHPLEMALSMGIKCALIVLLGAPVIAVMIFEIVLNLASLFAHANLRLPSTLDGWVRRVWVTPDMHRVHHSVVMRETNSNYGFHLSVWDRVFGSYRAQPEAGHHGMTIGLSEYQNTTKTGALNLLSTIPFDRHTHSA